VPAATPRTPRPPLTPEGTDAKRRLLKKISCSNPSTPAIVNDLRLQACRRPVAVTIRPSGLLGLELGCAFIEEQQRVVIDVVRAVPGELMESLGIRPGDWLEEVGHISIDLMNTGDTNDDGKLSATELASLLLQVRRSFLRLLASLFLLSILLFAHLFACLLLPQIRALAPPEEGDVPRARDLFEQYDRDRSGFLEPLELVDLINDHLLDTITNIVAKTSRPVEVTFSRADPAAARAARAYAETILAAVRAGCASTAAKVASAEAARDAALDLLAAAGIDGVLLKTKKTGVVAARYFVTQSHYLLYKSSAQSADFSG